MSTKKDPSGIAIPPDVPEGLRSEKDLIAPFEWYDTQRRDDPVRFSPSREVYDLFSYEAVKEAFHSPDRLVRPNPWSEDSSDADSSDPFKYIGRSVLWSDGSSHDRMKQEMFEHFTPAGLSQFRSTIEQITKTELTDEIGHEQSFDFVADFAVPVTLKVPMELLGMPKRDYPKVFEWIEAFIRKGPSEYSSQQSAYSEILKEATEYLDEFIQRRTRDPQDDLTSLFIHQTPMDREQIGANCFEILLAGQGTMTDFVSNALYLDDRQDIFSMTTDMRTVLEEVLRFRSPVQCQSRVTTEAVQIGGTEIPADSKVVLWIGSANRDPEQFENPGRFDPSRNADHLAFGHGSHSCIGFTLARIQAPIVLETFLNRFESVQIRDEEIQPLPSPAILSFERLPVTVQYS